MKKITLFGAGLSGSLLAIFLAKKGYEVTIFEKRADMRHAKVERGRSINLALSARGIRGLEKAGIAQEVLTQAIPMYGRMLHDTQGNLMEVPYGKNKTEYINSVSRTGLNIALLNLCDTFANIKIRFEHELISADLRTQEYTFKHKEQDFTQIIPHAIGTDGAGSVLRKALKKVLEDENGVLDEQSDKNFKESITFLEHGYKELTILPNENAKTEKERFLMEKNALHIWPRGSYMLIALANLDGSFTCTLFFPNHGENSFEELNTKEKINAFFEAKFKDTLTLIPDLAEQFLRNPVGNLGTVRCSPWFYKDRLLLLGDSAHAIVPFYGQGMNCAFEDCIFLDEFLQKNTENNHNNEKTNLEKTFEDFFAYRKPNADAIAELALENFYEMRDKTANPAFLRKRQLEHKLENMFEDYHSKYSLVTFHPEIPYTEAHRLGNAQDEFLISLCTPDDIFIEGFNLKKLYKTLKGF